MISGSARISDADVASCCGAENRRFASSKRDCSCFAVISPLVSVLGIRGTFIEC